MKVTTKSRDAHDARVHANVTMVRCARTAYERQPHNALAAQVYRVAAYRCLEIGGSAEYPSGYPSGESYLRACDRTTGAMRDWLATGDSVGTYTIDSDKLVHLLNAAAARKPEVGSELWHVIETLRDQLSETRQNRKTSRSTN